MKLVTIEKMIKDIKGLQILTQRVIESKNTKLNKKDKIDKNKKIFFDIKKIKLENNSVNSSYDKNIGEVYSEKSSNSSSLIKNKKIEDIINVNNDFNIENISKKNENLFSTIRNCINKKKENKK